MEKQDETKRFFRATSTPALIISATNSKYTISEVTDSFIEFTGMNRESIIDQSVLNLFSGEMLGKRDRLLQTIENAIENRITDKTECIDFHPKNGEDYLFSYFFCDVECIPVSEVNIVSKEVEINNLIISLSNIVLERDVIDNIQISDTESEEELLSGIWSYDIKTDHYTFSEELRRIYGIDSSTEKPSMEQIKQLIHPTDRTKRDRIINHAYSKGIEYYLSLRIIRKDNQVKNIVVIGYPKKDKNGNLIGYEGLTKTVVCKKLLEKKLFETLFEIHKKNKLIETLILNVPVGIALNRISTGETTLINDEFGKVFGWNNIKVGNLDSFLTKIYSDSSNRKDILQKIHSNSNSNKSELQKWHTIEVRTVNGTNKIVNTKHIPLPDQDMLITTSIDVTEKENLLIRLQKAIERYNLVSMATDDAVFDWDSNDNTIFWKNSILTQNLGYREGFERNTLKQWVNEIHPDDIDAFKTNLICFLKDKTATKWMPDYYRIKKADGTYAHIKELALVIRNDEGRVIRMVGVLRDITKRINEQLRLNMLELVVENMGDPVVITEADPLENPGPRIIYANPAFYRLTGYTLEEAIGNSPRVLQGELSNRIELDKLKASLIACQPFKLSTVNYKKNGEPMWIKAHISPVFDKKGKCINWVGVQRDITEEKKAELLLHELNKNLISQTEKLAVSNKELEQFAYITSHDLQEPLRMIISFLDLLEKKYEKNLDDKAKQYIHFAVDGALRLRQIIFDLLDYSRVGRQEYPNQVVNITTLITEVEHALHTLITEKNATVIKDNLPSLITKKTPLSQVFQNLISNALKYAKKDLAPIIRITSEEKEDYWQFSVSDNGEGIGDNFYEKVFVIFQRLHTKEEVPGTGLGLAITKKAIENMGGKIWVESKIGKGSTFYFTIEKVNIKK